MSNGSPSEDGATGGTRRAVARDKARQLRTHQKKRDRRRRWLLQGGIAVGILAVIAVVVVVLATSIHPPQRGPANMASDGILIETGGHAKRTAPLRADQKPRPNPKDTTGQVVNIVTYVDYLCPYCGQFERTNHNQLQRLITSGAATVEVHPVPFFASGSGSSQYSLRAANAAACVANYAPDAFWAFNSLMFQNQPKQNSSGLPDSRIKQYVTAARATDATAIGRCIDKQTYASWTQAALTRAADGPLANTSVKKLKTTPLVLVDGQQYTGSLTSASDFRAFLVQVESESYATATPTPGASGTPSPTPTSVVVGSTPTPSATTTPTPAP